MERILNRTRQSLVPGRPVQQCKTQNPTIRPVLRKEAWSRYTSQSTHCPASLPLSSNKNNAHTSRKATPRPSPTTLPPPAQITRAHQDRRWHTPQCVGRTATTTNARDLLAKNRGHVGTHNSPRDRANQASPTITTGDRRWKRILERTGSHNNLAEEEPEGLITRSQAGSIVSTTFATNTDGKRWTPATTPVK